MFWPTLIVVVVLALQAAQPVKLLVWFLAGGLLTTVSCGIALVFLLQGSSLFSGSAPSVDPVVNISMGVLSLLAAYLLDRRGRKPPAHPEAGATPPPKPKKTPLTQRVTEKGARSAFAAGIVLNIVPGTFPIIALANIAELDTSNAAKVATIIAFYVIMFAFVEVPVVAYLFAPERTTAAVDDFNAWLGRNGRRLAVYVIAAAGIYFTVKGIVQLFR
jgi:hypothetical protein